MKQRKLKNLTIKRRIRMVIPVDKLVKSLITRVNQKVRINTLVNTIANPKGEILMKEMKKIKSKISF